MQVTATGGTPPQRADAALALHRALLAARPAGVADWIHAPESVLLELDDDAEPAAVQAAVHALAARPAASASAPRRFVLPVVFGGEYGPDLAAVAADLGCTPDALIERITAHDLVIAAVGGNLLPLLAGLRLRATVARLASPRPAVPAGSVGLAGDRACVYPVGMPGGWRLVGRTPLTLVDLASTALAAYAAGDTVRLEAVDARDWAALAAGPQWT